MFHAQRGGNLRPLGRRGCQPDQLARLARFLDLDLPQAFGDRPSNKTWGDLKLEAAISVLDAGRPLVWADDEEAAAARRLFPAVARAERLGQALLVTPQSEFGLRPDDLDRIEAFVLRWCRPGCE